MTWTYNVGLLLTPSNPLSPLMQIRRLIGDVLLSDQQLQDEEIIWINSRYSNIYSAAAECCRDIAANFSRQVDLVQGELKNNYSRRAVAYMIMAKDLENRGLRGVIPYAGGISNEDKFEQATDPDRVTPAFNVQEFDNLLPVGPAGNETPTNNSPDTGGVA